MFSMQLFGGGGGACSRSPQLPRKMPMHKYGLAHGNAILNVLHVQNNAIIKGKTLTWSTHARKKYIFLLLRS